MAKQGKKDSNVNVEIETPTKFKTKSFQDSRQAVQYLTQIFGRNTEFLREKLTETLNGRIPASRVRAYYPFVRLTTTTHASTDSRLSYGFVVGPGKHGTTITRPDLFEKYYQEQIDLLIRNHQVPVEVGESKQPIPVHFAFFDNTNVEMALNDKLDRPLQDIFDVPLLSDMNDSIANGELEISKGDEHPLAPFTGPRVDYSLARLQHYTATSAEHFQKFVLFTNYQFYIDEFCRLSRKLLNDGNMKYEAFVEPGNIITKCGDKNSVCNQTPGRLPQMPAYHLIGEGGKGITMVNIGVGPSNAKTITDHVAVLRPLAWLMLGHCAGLRNSQTLGDYVLAHGYVRDDHVLDADLPIWVPIPALAEVQTALEEALADVSGLQGYELKRIMRTGTVATIDNRNWELLQHQELVQRFSQSRAIALDMESATIAANGFRFRVPYGTLLCVSDKPLHGELKLPGMATDFYRRQVNQHLSIGIRAMELLKEMPLERLHSRKLRSFAETAFQ